MSTTPTSPTTQSPLTWQLIGLSPALSDLTLDIDRDLTVGRNAQNDVVLASGQVSRQHARLTVQDGQVWLQDLGSANGTFVNGSRIADAPVALQLGDEVAFAELAFVVASDDLADGMDTLEAMLTTPNAQTTDVYTISHELPTAKDLTTDNAIHTTATADIDTPTISPAPATKQPQPTPMPTPTATDDAMPKAAALAPTPSEPAPALLPTASEDHHELAKQGSKHSTVAIAVVVIVALIIIVALFFR